jgi:hypothetical protein
MASSHFLFAIELVTINGEAEGRLLVNIRPAGKDPPPLPRFAARNTRTAHTKPSKNMHEWVVQDKKVVGDT